MTIADCQLPTAVLSFIGIAVNLWRTSRGTGGTIVPAQSLVNRFNIPIVDRFNNEILLRSVDKIIQDRANINIWDRNNSDILTR